MFLSFIFSAKSNSANWIEISSDGSSTYFIDGSSIKRYPNKIVKLWIKTTYSNPQKIEYSQKEYNALLNLVKYNCPDNLIMQLQTTMYFDLDVIDSETAKNPIYTDIIPDSMGDLIKEAVCYQASNRNKAN